MAEPNDVKAIESISAAVGESQIKILLSNQCMKAQAFLVNRLTKQFTRQKEISQFISNDNLKLEAEIKNAEQEIKSLMLAHASIKTANVELKKEWHLAKERTQETAERIQVGEKKYDELWEQCKSRYESISFVQNWQQASKKKEALEENINVLEKETKVLLDEIRNKENIISELTKKRIIELAEYFVHEKPKVEQDILNLSKEIKELNAQVEQLMKSQETQNVQNKDKAENAEANLRAQSQKLSDVKIDDGWLNLNKNVFSSVTLMPKLQLMNIDLDVMSVKLDQIKKSDFITPSPVKEVAMSHQTLEIGSKSPEKASRVSLYFQNSSTGDSVDRNNSHNYSKRKLINILEDIKLDKSDTYNIVSKVNVNNLQGVSEITAHPNKNKDIHTESPKRKVQSQPQEAEIEEIDLTSSNVEHIILPPTGFIDQLRSSQEKKKTVSFDLPSQQKLSLDSKKCSQNQKEVIDIENEANTINNSPMNETAGSEESFTKIKDMILKKHNLDLSPTFVYSKNTITPQKHEEVVKSNYFKLSCEEMPSISEVQSGTGGPPADAEMECDEPVQADATENEVEANDVEMEVSENVISSAKANREHIARPVTGLLFNHGSGIPDSLDVSISTTGFEDGDTDYPQYSSLLLSPKADLPMPSTNDKTDVVSQDVPNFLSGLRKTGLSFFGSMAGTSSNTENSSAPSGNSFNFAFGGDDKKKRGGLFNMFN
ncbi:myosin heavy chain, striated muscle-like [Leguminivora glycinivorella]|uniref:myosin heavy chain, striated muscle-like n=1 Tax=Leguminivora glycinivorella TaxID=1035111 RepID=UPI0020106C6D|nr:myosin heavy chain, striated muscle-like [Leguminivora glycinivorella]